MWQKAKITKTSLDFGSGEKVCDEFSAADSMRGFYHVGLWRFGHFEVMIPIWILLYGAAIVCGGAYSVRVVPMAGWCFIALGAVAFYAARRLRKFDDGFEFRRSAHCFRRDCRMEIRRLEK